jgi:hypothetical protein
MAVLVTVEVNGQTEQGHDGMLAILADAPKRAVRELHSLVAAQP